MPSITTSKPLLTKRVSLPKPSRARVGDHVELIAGALAGMTGEVVRLETGGLFLVGVPVASSGLLVRVPQQRFRTLATPAER
jgi:hypothetical protein